MNKPKIEFVPGCFDDFEGTQEELNELVAAIQEMIDNDTIFENSRELTEEDFEELSEEAKAKIISFFEDEDQPPKRNLQ
jgi:hypothetical protein